MASLTLCMIVRDEEKWLEGCLASVSDLVDRMVVVDTGSTDRTRAIAESAGAEIVEFDWIDDFAAARNAGLAAIDEGYVLVLDADERLTEEGAAAVRAAVSEGGFALGLLPLHDAIEENASAADVVSGRARKGEPMWLPRLLLRTPDLAYEGIVHESVGRWAAKHGEAKVIDAPLVHYGAVESLRESREKSTRNRSLLERRCAEDPDDPMPHAYLAAELRKAGDLRGALDIAERGWAAWRRQHGRGGASEAALPATMAGHLSIVAGKWDEAEALLGEALAAESHPNLNLLSGVAIEQRWLSRGGAVAELDAAAGHYARCLELEGQAFASEKMPGATTWQAATRLGTVQLLLDRPEAALEAFEHALTHAPDSREAALGRAEALIESERSAEAVEALETLATDDEPDAWLLLGEVTRRAGSSADAAAPFVERARQIRTAIPFVGKHRDILLAQCLQETHANDRCVFAWPRYDSPDDLDALLGHYGKLLAGVRGLVLCLRHDTELDGAADDAAARIESAFQRHMSPDDELHVILIDEPLETQQQVAKLAGPKDLSIELPGTDGEAVRRRFLNDLGTERVATPAELEAALAN